MKYVKILGLAAVAAMATMAFAASASATELYSGATTQVAGTVIEATLEPGTSAALTDTAGNPIDTCTTSTVKGTITNAGSSTTTPSGPISTLSWGGATDPCSQPTTTTALGELEIHHITGTDNGTVTGKNNKVTINVFGVSCVYGTGTGTTLGTLTGKTSTAENATMDINAIINEQEPKQFLCPDTGKWVGSYVVTTPKGLNVRAS